MPNIKIPRINKEIIPKGFVQSLSYKKKFPAFQFTLL